MLDTVKKLVADGHAIHQISSHLLLQALQIKHNRVGFTHYCIRMTYDSLWRLLDAMQAEEVYTDELRCIIIAHLWELDYFSSDAEE